MAVTELELRQAGLWALGHGGPGKPSSASLILKTGGSVSHSLLPLKANNGRKHFLFDCKFSVLCYKILPGYKSHKRKGFFNKLHKESMMNKIKIHNISIESGF